MKIISSTLHGILDYATVIFLFIAPSLFKLENMPGQFTYATAVLQLVLTLLTNYEGGLVRWIPFIVHGWIEGVFGVVLIVAAFFFRYADDTVAFRFNIIVAFVYFVVILLTNYKSSPKKLTSLDPLL